MLKDCKQLNVAEEHFEVMTPTAKTLLKERWERVAYVDWQVSSERLRPSRGHPGRKCDACAARFRAGVQYPNGG